MQFGTIGNEYKYDYNADAFRVAFDFLHRTDIKDLPEGWINLGEGVRASVQHYTTMPSSTLLFETHERFFDIQYLIEGIELLGICKREGLVIKKEYDENNDVTFYEDPDCAGQVLLRDGDYVVFAPEDAHKPRCLMDHPLPVKKIVVKVPVSSNQ